MTLSGWMDLVLWADVLQGPQDREVTPMPAVAPGRDTGIRKFIPYWTGAAQLCVRSQVKEQLEQIQDWERGRQTVGFRGGLS